MPASPVIARSRHPINIALYEKATIGARIADRVTKFIGSWRFLAIQTVIVMAWIAGKPTAIA